MMKHGFLAVAVGALIVVGLSPALRADTLYTGVLDPDTVRLMCFRADARYHDFGADGYGCRSSKISITCRSDLQCVSKVRDLNSYMGEPLDAYMRQHGLKQVDPLSRAYSE
jgi:hypothetical protein